MAQDPDPFGRTADDRETIAGWLPPAPAPPAPAAPSEPAGFAPPGAPVAAPSGTPAPPRGRANGKATASLAFGVAGLIVLPFVCSVLALVLGYRARDEIARTGQGGAGSATAGIVLGWVGLVCFVLLLVAVIGFGVEPTLERRG